MTCGKFFAFALSLGLFLVLTADGQPPGGPPPKGPPGFGFGGPKGGQKGFKGGPGNSGPLLDELKLNDEQRQKANQALRAYDERVRRQTTEARQELLAQMKEILPEDQYRAFRDELEQVPLIPALPPGPRGVPAEELVERLMSYDANGDGKVTRDELPPRMQSLIDQGDTNGDGALDRDEIRALVGRASVNGPRILVGPGGGPPFGPPRGPGGPPGGPPRKGPGKE
jgi:Spy/CpxP family protein refolding chaperone